MGYEANFTVKVFVRFLRRLIENSGAKAYLIVDNLRVHQAH